MNTEINIKRLDQDFLLEASNSIGNTILIDASEPIGGHHQGIRPLELLLSSLGSCSSIDVILILRKQKQECTSFAVEIQTERITVDQHTEFSQILLIFKIEGPIKKSSALKAIKLSIDKYCSVAKILETKSQITTKLILNGKEEF
ncbi:MAG: OsmC family protein [Saprospiraceae bacterium]|nr:OsmC family protein [Saprospiraceae bacterium]MBK7809669.1 OsmC family protein [Saprospiraceae bacterium]MBK9632220.1 OsmC family protein [Saprospiraceae bacterium]